MRPLVRIAEILSSAIGISLLVLPLGFFFWRSRPSCQNFAAVFSEPALASSLIHTLEFALGTAFISTAAAFLILWLLWRFQFSPNLVRFVTATLKLPYLLPAFLFAM